MKRSNPIKVLIVDDSALVRSILTRVISEAPDIQVAGGAKDPFEARELIIEYRPDVIILDIEMPRMDGLSFLKKLQAHYPVPVIMCSGVAPANSRAALEAVECGAVDVVAKPNRGGSAALKRLGQDLTEKIRAAAVAITSRSAIPVPVNSEPSSFRAAGLDPNQFLVAVGASTGGTEAIRQLLTNVPADFPPIAIVQHMPEGFTSSFAERLNDYCRLTVTEAVDGDVLSPGRALLARGGRQMRVRFSGGTWRIKYGDTEDVNRHCPSVDVLFESVARSAGRRAVGILLTGMGADGADGLLKIKQAGAPTFAQSKETCVVYGMPKVAVERGAVQHSAPPQQIPSAVIHALEKKSAAKKRPTSSIS